MIVLVDECDGVLVCDLDLVVEELVVCEGVPVPVPVNECDGVVVLV